LLALQAGLTEVVKASLTGSILGNLLLVLGLAMFVGGWNRDRQTFNRTNVGAATGMLILTVVALLMPDIYAETLQDVAPLQAPNIMQISVLVAIVMLCVYVASLVFSFRTHRDLIGPAHDTPEAPTLTRGAAIVLLAGATVLTAIGAEILVGSIEHASSAIGVSQFFVVASVVAIVGNAAEHYVAVVAAAKDKMDLAVNIAIGSSAQIGLFVAPVLVLLSFLFGPSPMALVFNPYELGALLAAGLVATSLLGDGESTWFEGVQLLALYAVIGIVFYAA